MALGKPRYVLAPTVVAVEVVVGSLLPLALLRRPAHLAAGVGLTAALAVVGMVGAAEVRELVWAQGWRGR